MKILVKVKANSKENKVVPPVLKLLKIDDENEEYFSVSVKDPPREGRANSSVKKLLAEYFKVSISQVTLLKGETSKIKVFEIIK